jgi:acetyl-CoA carboxylase alpha subunit
MATALKQALKQHLEAVMGQDIGELLTQRYGRLIGYGRFKE